MNALRVPEGSNNKLSKGANNRLSEGSNRAEDETRPLQAGDTLLLEADESFSEAYAYASRLKPLDHTLLAQHNHLAYHSPLPAIHPARTPTHPSPSRTPR